MTKGVRWLLILNTSIFVATFLLYQFTGIQLTFLKLIPDMVVSYPLPAVWQLVTYGFLHDLHQFEHILWNMVSLFFLGPALEGAWGTARFIRFYLYCVIGAAVLVILVSFPLHFQSVPTIGASGGIFGILATYWFLFPDMMFFGILRAKYVVMIYAAIALLGSITAHNMGVSYVAHLGGLITGAILVKSGIIQSRRSGTNLFSAWERQYKDWKLARARRKFQVYMHKQPGSKRSDKDTWVN